MDVKQLIDNFKNVVTGHYADFNGRANRAEFWQYVLVYVVIAVIFDILHIRILQGLYALAMLLPTLGISVRRLHDVGKSGWLVLLPIVPGVLMYVTAFAVILIVPFIVVTLACMAYLIYLYVQPSVQAQA